MKKFNLFIGLFVILALMLSACGGIDISTTGNGQETVFEEEDDITIDETPEDAVDETEDPDSLVPDTGTEDDDGTPVVVETPQVPVTGIENNLQLSYLMDFEVLSIDNEVLGEVNDFILNIGNLQIEYALVDVGGFLGIDEKTVAVPYDRLVLSDQAADIDMLDTEDTSGLPTDEIEDPDTDVTDDLDTDDTDELDTDDTSNIPTNDPEDQDTTTAQEDDDLLDDNQQMVFYLDITREELETAPEFDFETLPNLGTTTAGEWDSEYRNFWDGDALTETDDEENQEELNETNQLATVVLASDMLDLMVLDNRATELANVYGVVVEQQSGILHYLVINEIAIRGLQDRALLVPLGAVSWNYNQMNASLGFSIDPQVLITQAVILNNDSPLMQGSIED